MGLFGFGKKKKTAVEEVAVTPIQEQAAPVSTSIASVPAGRIAVVTMDALQIMKLETFVETHKTTCKMDVHHLVIARNSKTGDRIFTKCPICERGIEIETEHTPIINP